MTNNFLDEYIQITKKYVKRGNEVDRELLLDLWELVVDYHLAASKAIDLLSNQNMKYKNFTSKVTELADQAKDDIERDGGVYEL